MRRHVALPAGGAEPPVEHRAAVETPVDRWRFISRSRDFVL
jgi:hypothetical protein